MVMTSTIIPLEASADGKRNAHTFFCKAVGYHIHYAVCIARMNDEATIHDNVCRNNVGSSACAARTMREDELAAGKAIYFMERIRPVEQTSLVSKALELVHRGPVPEPQPIPLATAPATPADYMAQAITRAVADEKAPRRARPERLEVKPGETMVQAARRMLAVRNSQN